MTERKKAKISPRMQGPKMLVQKPQTSYPMLKSNKQSHMQLIVDNGSQDVITYMNHDSTLPASPESSENQKFKPVMIGNGSDVEDCEVRDEDEEHVSNYSNVNVGNPSRMTYEGLTAANDGTDHDITPLKNRPGHN